MSSKKEEVVQVRQALGFQGLVPSFIIDLILLYVFPYNYITLCVKYQPSLTSEGVRSLRKYENKSDNDDDAENEESEENAEIEEEDDSEVERLNAELEEIIENLLRRDGISINGSEEDRYFIVGEAAPYFTLRSKYRKKMPLFFNIWVDQLCKIEWDIDTTWESIPRDALLSMHGRNSEEDEILEWFIRNNKKQPGGMNRFWG